MSSLRVVLWYMALMMLIMPALVMKLDSMLRLCRVLFSISISATACVSPQGVTSGCHLGQHPTSGTSWATDAPGDGGKATITWPCWCPGWSLGQGTVSPPCLGTWRGLRRGAGDTGLGLTLATGSLLRVATRLSFLTWVLVFMASQMAFSVEMGMSCSKGMWVSPRGCGCH